MGKIKKQNPLSSSLKPTESKLKSKPNAFKVSQPTTKPPATSKTDRPVVDEFKDFSMKEEARKDNLEKRKKKLSKPSTGISKKKLTKMEKQLLKKEEVLQKIELTKRAFESEKAKKKREKTVVVKDMRPLLDALPILDSVMNVRKAGDLRSDKNVSRKQQKAMNRQKQVVSMQQKMDQHKTLITNFSQMTPEMRRQAIREMTKKRIQETEQAAIDNGDATME